MSPHSLRALFAPDWRDGVRYQQLLANALARHGVTVSYLSGYRRLLPLSRLRRAASEHDVLHLHWPEAYYPAKGDGFDLLRSMRFALDLALTVRQGPMVATAHNLHAHNRGEEWLAHRNYGIAFRRSRAVFAHSAAARSLLINRFRLNEDRVHVVPHGDLSVTMPTLPARADARRRLALGDDPVCLMFGAIEPYKGVEEVIAFWRDRNLPVRLVIAGKPFNSEYAAEIRDAAAGVGNTQLALERLAEQELCDWLAATDCVLFNYEAILTSGAAALTRSLGIPLLIPERCATVDLREPDDRVMRFDTFGDEFVDQMARAIALGTDLCVGPALADRHLVGTRGGTDGRSLSQIVGRQDFRLGKNLRCVNPGSVGLSGSRIGELAPDSNQLGLSSKRLELGTYQSQ